MKKLVTGNQKGGVGKTTLARALSFFGNQKLGLRVLVIDFDVQENLAKTMLNVRAKNGYGPANDEALTVSGMFNIDSLAMPVHCGDGLDVIAPDSGVVEIQSSALEDIIDALKVCFARLDDQYDICIIDTAPSVSNLLIAALACADFAISPCEPDSDAIEGFKGFASNIHRVVDHDLNPNLLSLGLIPNRVNKSSAYHKSILDQLRESWGDVVLPVDLFIRAATAAAKDHAVWTTERGESSSQAAQEMLEACNQIFTRMGWKVNNGQIS